MLYFIFAIALILKLSSYYVLKRSWLNYHQDRLRKIALFQINVFLIELKGYKKYGKKADLKSK